MINKRPVTWRGVGISVLRGAVTGVAFGAVGKAISGSMSATTRLINYSRRAIQTQRTVTRTTRVVRRAAPVARKAAPVAKPVVKKIAGKLTGYTKHGINSAINHNGKGIKPWVIRDILKNPTKVINQSDGVKKYINSKGTVILNKYGKVVTTWAKSRKYWR